MKKSILVGVILFFTTFVNAQINYLKFNKGKKIPEPVYGMSYCSVTDGAILLGGRSFKNYDTKYVFKYDKKNNTWLNLTNSSSMEPQVYGTASFLGSEYNSLILSGGITNYANHVGVITDLVLYDLNNLNMNTLGPNPTPAKSQGAVYWKDKLYVFGGSLSMEVNKKSRNVKYNNALYEYNLSTGLVSQLPNMPESKEVFGVIIDDQIFTLGGYNGISNNKIHSYSIENKQWSLLDSLSEPISAYAIVSYKHLILTIGDYQNRNQLLVYDTKTQKETVFEMNFSGRHMGAAVINGDLHVFGGFDPKQTRNQAMNQHWYISLVEILDKIDKS